MKLELINKVKKILDSISEDEASLQALCDGFARIMVKTALECQFSELSISIEDFKRGN